MMMPEQRAKMILDILAKRVGYACCELGEPQPNSLDQATVQGGEAAMMPFPLALQGSEPRGHRKHLASKTKGYVKAVFPASKLEELRKIQRPALLAEALEASAASNEDICAGAAGIQPRCPKTLFPPKPAQRIFLKAGKQLWSSLRSWPVPLPQPKRSPKACSSSGELSLTSRPPLLPSFFSAWMPSLQELASRES